MASNDTAPAADIPLIPGQSPPFSVITETDRSGLLIIATALSLVVAFVFTLIRLFIRLQFNAQFAKDDAASFLSMLFTVIHASIVFVAISKGFGKTMVGVAPELSREWQKDLYVSDIFYLVTMWLTKCSVAMLFLRLSPDRVHIRGSQAVLGTCTVFVVASILIASLRCDLASPWVFAEGGCSGLFSRWVASTTFDILTEVGLFVISLLLVQGLQLPLQKKLVVMIAFGFRLVVIALSILRLSALETQFASPDPSLHGVPAAVWTQIELAFAIVATTTPCFKPFMSALNTHYGGPTSLNTPTGTKASVNSGNEHSMATLPTSKARPEGPVGPKTRWDGTEYNVEVGMGGDVASVDSDEGKKMIISKNTSWAVDFEEQGVSTGQAL